MGKELGKELRLSRIFNPTTDRSIVVAMDHGMFLGAIAGIENILKAVENVVEGQPDALQITAGVASFASQFLKGKNAPGFVLRVDATNIWRSHPEPKEGYHAVVASVEDAVRLNANAVVAFFFVGYESDRQEAENLERLANLASQCRLWQMPLVIEPLVIEKGAHAVRDPKRIKLAVRIASELGADVLKVDYTGDPKSFSEVVDAATAPILVRGGPKMETDEAVLQMVKEAIDVEAKGLVFGRNIWQHKNPAAMLDALRAIVHENATVDEAMKRLKKRLKR
ncbi:MAG: class I fructose-bisphosphate aldolase [Armatimonadetes bacterium]|nr:class I fructose-bisphosphate aldolase [Armatimonadota bacterium]